jgi:hypothetical protein
LCVIVSDPINPVVNPIPVLYSRRLRATIGFLLQRAKPPGSIVEDRQKEKREMRETFRVVKREQEITAHKKKGRSDQRENE